MEDNNKKIRILVAAAKRIQKDYFSYKQELEQQQLELDIAKQIINNEYKVRKLEELIVETQSMFPNVKDRLTQTISSLENFIIEHEIAEQEFKIEVNQTIQIMKDFLQVTFQ